MKDGRADGNRAKTDGGAGIKDRWVSSRAVYNVAKREVTLCQQS